MRVLDVNRACPDGTFLEDTAIVLDEVAVLTSMGTEARRAELPGIERELRQYRQVQRIALPATIEGGDVLRIGARFWSVSRPEPIPLACKLSRQSSGRTGMTWCP